jgi:hypothetical protein
MPAYWALTNSTCDNGSTASQIILNAGQTVTCTLTNTKLGNIVVRKVTLPASTQSFTFTPSYNGGATFPLTSGQSNDSGLIQPGTYSVSETVPSGWRLISSTCDNGNAPSAITFTAGQTVTCTFTNRRVSMIGVFRNGAWYLDSDGSGSWNGATDTTVAAFGASTDIPVTGDWNGDGKTEIGTFRSGAWYLDSDGSGTWSGATDTTIAAFGGPGDIPVTGDWNGDGKTEIGVFRNGAWYLDSDGSGTWSGATDTTIAAFGGSTDKPVSGKW